MQLRSFGTECIRTPAQLRALPAAALTRLGLHHCSAWRSGLDLNSDGRWYLRYTNLFHQRFQFSGLDLHDQMAKELCAYMEKEYVSLY